MTAKSLRCVVVLLAVILAFFDLLTAPSVQAFAPRTARVPHEQSQIQRVRSSFPRRKTPRTSDDRFQSKLFSSNDESSLWSRTVEVSTVVSQPIVWSSLYFVKTTGAGLPAGPFGILGALEGLSYLVILATLPSSRISRATLVVALVVLAALVTDQGCLPNAKPILDYSSYVPVCESQPGLFGG